MSKLSEGLKALINAAHSKPGMLRAPPGIRNTYAGIAESARSKGVGVPAWLSLTTAATMTMNSPSSMLELFALTQSLPSPPPAPTAASLMREVGLKCISFNGIPRSINCLNAFHDGLPKSVTSALPKPTPRNLTPRNLEQRLADGRALWDSVYRPFEDKLLAKLATSHPNLPVHILEGHYATLLSNPASNDEVQVGRLLTSLVAIACLRTQTGVGPQVLSHVFGLRKAFADGSAEQDVEGGAWLATEEGNTWILNTIDEVVQALSQGKGTTFAEGQDAPKAKL